MCHWCGWSPGPSTHRRPRTGSPRGGVPLFFVKALGLLKPAELTPSSGDRLVVRDLRLVRLARAEHGQNDVAASALEADDGRLRQRRVTLAGRPIELTPTEYGVLAELTASAGRVMTHGQLLQRVWGARLAGDSGPVRNIVARLRRKLGDDADSPTHIFSERYVGYRFANPPE